MVDVVRFGNNNYKKCCGCRHTSMMDMSKTKFYRTYNAMKDRCYNKDNTN